MRVLNDRARATAVTASDVGRAAPAAGPSYGLPGQPEQTIKQGVNVGRLYGVNFQRRLTFKCLDRVGGVDMMRRTPSGTVKTGSTLCQ